MDEIVNTTKLVPALFVDKINKTTIASVAQHDIEDEKVMVFKYIQIVLLIFVLITGVVGNILVITSLSKPWRKLKSFEILALSLGMSDLLYSLANPTLSIFNSWGFGRGYGDTGCRIHSWIARLAYTASAWVLMVISIDRFIEIVLRPLSLADERRWKTLLVIFAIWIINGSFAVVYNLPVKIYQNGELFSANCLINLPRKTMHIHVAFPCLVTTSLYCIVVSRLQRLQPIGNDERVLEAATKRN